MRLHSLSIAGFRGFPVPVKLDLDADAIVVAGVNGSGKTSLFDAILWALCGSVDRLAGEPGVVVSQYSPTGEARVEVVARSGDGSTITIVRRFDGASHLTVQRNGSQPVTGAAADAMLIDLLWPDAKAASNQVIALTRSLTRATYLQQDEVRAFVAADTQQMRFEIVGELVGAGRIGELQRQLESSRNAWTRATTALAKELSPLESQRVALAERISRLGTGDDAGDVEGELTAWAQAVVAESGMADVPVAPPGKPPVLTADALDRTLSELLAREQAVLRTQGALQRLLSHLRSLRPTAADLKPFEEAAVAAETRVRNLSAHLATAEAQAAEVRRVQLQLEERNASLRALAQLALQHLDENCPVCGQTYDVESTRARLVALVDAGGEVREVASSPDVSGAAIELATAEADLATARDALRSAQLQQQRLQEWDRQLVALQRSAGLEAAPVGVHDVEGLLTETKRLVERLGALRVDGEHLALGLARASELAQRADLQKQMADLDSNIAARRRAIAAREATGDLASSFITALRSASGSVVTAELERIEPLLQRIFATVDPHPSFRVVRFLTKMSRGHGHLWTAVDDTSGAKSVEDPSLVLSSSQINVLAVAIFLSLNLAIPTLPLQVIALDDPLQSLDTVNLLGLADLLRRVKASRQVIVSTHDDRLAGLLVRKLRPVTPHERTIRIDLSAWTPDGPLITPSEVPPDERPLRLVAAS